jgi:hypothetical protein
LPEIEDALAVRVAEVISDRIIERLGDVLTVTDEAPYSPLASPCGLAPSPARLTPSSISRQ